MSVVIHSDGHLTIKILYEQIWPVVVGDDIEFVVCYDIILRSYSNRPLQKLYLLSSHAGSMPVFDLLPDDSFRKGDWIFSDKRRIDARNEYQITFPSSSIGEHDKQYEATPLFPILQTPKWMLSESNSKHAATFWGTGFTLAEVVFRDGVVIEPWDPKRKGSTTYWLRIAFRTKVESLLDEPMRFGDATSPIFKVRPYFIFSHEMVLGLLSMRLAFLARNSDFNRSAFWLATKIFSELFEKESTSTSVEDHRISLVTDTTSLVLNPVSEGDCIFVGINSIRGKENSKVKNISRTWISGAEYFRHSDPSAMAYDVYNYLSKWAYNLEDAKTIEGICSVFRESSSVNVSHTVRALRKLNLLEEPKPGYFSINQKSEHDARLVFESYRSPEHHAIEKERVFRDTLFGTVPDPVRRDTATRFRHKGYRISFELAYVST